MRRGWDGWAEAVSQRWRVTGHEAGGGEKRSMNCACGTHRCRSDGMQKQVRRAQSMRFDAPLLTPSAGVSCREEGVFPNPDKLEEAAKGRLFVVSVDGPALFRPSPSLARISRWCRVESCCAGRPRDTSSLMPGTCPESDGRADGMGGKYTETENKSRVDTYLRVV